MRLLIYLLALVSGFSAAEAARAEVSAASPVAQTAVAAAEALASQEQRTATRPANRWPLAKTVVPAVSTPLAILPQTRISRHDSARE